MKIHSEEVNKEGFENIPLEEISRMVGWVEPPMEQDGTWGVTTSDDGVFECSTQEIAYIMAGVEEIKAIILRTQTAEEKSK